MKFLLSSLLLLLCFHVVSAQPTYEAVVMRSVPYPVVLDSALTLTLRWDMHNLSNVDIHFCEDYNQNFATPNNWIPVVLNHPAVAGSYTWQTPNHSLAHGKFRIRSSTDSTVYDFCDGTLTVQPGKPMGQIRLDTITDCPYSKYKIWWATQDVRYVNLLVERPYGWAMINEEPIKGGPYASSSPLLDFLFSGDIRYRVEDAENPDVFDERLVGQVPAYYGSSLPYFMEYHWPNNPPFHHSIEPRVAPGSTYRINLEQVTTDLVVSHCHNLMGSIGGQNTWVPLDTLPSTAQFYDWVAPSTPGRYRLRLKPLTLPCEGNIHYRDIIVLGTGSTPQGQLKLIYPLGGDTISDNSIALWQSAGQVSETVLIETSSDNGLTWVPTTEGRTASGNGQLFQYPFPSPAVSQLIRISDRNNGQLFDQLASPVTCMLSPTPLFDWATMDQCRTLMPGQPFDFALGSSCNLYKLSYAEDVSGSFGTPLTWVTIIDSLASVTHTWTVPPISASKVWLKAECLGSREEVYRFPLWVIDTVQNPVQLQITNPQPGETWNSGSESHNLSWRVQGYEGPLKFEFTRNGGQTWVEYEVQNNNVIWSLRDPSLEGTLAYPDRLEDVGQDRTKTFHQADYLNSQLCQFRISVPCQPSLSHTMPGTFTIGGLYIGNQDPRPSGMRVFPNPSTGLVHVETLDGSTGRIEALDITGRRIGQWDMASDTHTLDLAAQPSGIYFLRLSTATGTWTEKIQISR